MIYEEMCLCVVAISRKNNSVNSILLLPLEPGRPIWALAEDIRGIEARKCWIIKIVILKHFFIRRTNTMDLNEKELINENVMSWRKLVMI